MEKIDARGLSCPKPVIMTKKMLDENKEVEVLVDNNVAAQNVKKLGLKMGGNVTIVKEKEKLFKVIIKNLKVEDSKDSKDEKKKVIFIKSNLLGQGDDELGEILIRGFINTLQNVKPLPDKIIFMNAGVKLPTTNKDIIKSLIKLNDEGVDILSCGTCLEYYNLKDKLKVGSISNMYEIVDSLNKSEVIEI